MQPEAAADSAALAELQRGFLALVTGRGALRPHSRSERAALGAVAAPSPAAAREALGVYRRMYALRMAREVAREYPATRALLGRDTFARVARAFVAARASHAFTLEGYAAALPAFLRRTRALSDARLRRDAVALARLERALTEARFAPRAEAPLRPGALAHADGAVVLALPCDAEAAFGRFERGERVGALRARSRWVAVYRHRGAATRLRVARCEAPLLRALLRGAPLARAVAAAANAGLGPRALRAAFERWVGAGLLHT
jgi:hypothetical protein